MITICRWEDRFAADYIRLSVEWLEKYVRVESADEAILYHPHEAVLDNGGMIFFALDSDTPIGTVSMIRMTSECFELAKLAVTEGYKGRGVSKLLMDAALDYARAEGCDKVILFTNRKLVPAIGLYQRYGFQEVPMVDNEYEESDVRMELEMKEADKMDFMALAKARYSVRKYKKEQIDRSVLDQILEAGNAAPTGVNYQPQRIYVLQSEEALAKAKALCPCTFDAPTVLLFAYDDDQDWDNPKQPGVHSGVQDVSIVATHIMLAAWSLGVASCWVNLFPTDAVHEAFNLPENEKVVLMMPLGYAAEDAKPAKWHDACKPIEETVSYL